MAVGLRKTWPVVAMALWLIGIGIAMFAVFAYSARPGEAATAPLRWPSELPLARAAQRPAVVMLAHPKCPCTRASLGELAQIATRADGKADFHVLFMRPDGADDRWTDTDTYRRAAELPGVVVTSDPGGRIAARLGAMTSGHVVVYDAAGALRFSGGITAARGHEGDNAGRQSVLAILAGSTANAAASKTFGCGLVGNEQRGNVQ